MQVYNAHQQVFALSLISNFMQKYKGTQDALQRAYEAQLPLILRMLPGEWKITWGPVVWKHTEAQHDPETGPDHVWFVVRNEHLQFPDGQRYDTYVTAVAGSATTYNWIQNNSRVDQVVEFPKWIRDGITTEPQPAAATSPEGCYIAYGTALGVHRLASVAPPSSANSRLPLSGYWASFPPMPKTKLVFTGHSLGGALSPTLALGLYDSRAFDNFSLKNVLVYPTAGPTPGNLQFTQHFAATFPRIQGKRYECWNCNVVNRLDIVSQAWCTSADASPDQNMANIPPIYGTPALWQVSAAVHLAEIRANWSQTLYIPLPPLFFRGTSPLSRPANLKEFIETAKEQHTAEFLKLFGIEIPDLPVDEMPGVVKMTQQEADSTEPILRTVVLAASQETGGANAASLWRGEFDMVE